MGGRVPAGAARHDVRGATVRIVASPLARLVAAGLEAARRALRDLDGDQVPADLRRVVAHSGALTPPLAGSLIRALDRYDWLRAKAIDAWPEADSGADDRAVALGTLFLERPPGWSERLASEVVAAARAEAAESQHRSDAAIADLERELAEAGSRLRDERRRGDRERARLVEQRDEARAAVRAAKGGEARGDAALRRRAERAEAAGADARADLEAARAELLAVRELAAEERRKRAAAEHSLAEISGGRVWPRKDPEALAVYLDDAARMARADGGEPGGGAGSAEGGALRLPEGVAPDAADAIDWLLDRRGPTTVIVDGYNAGFALAGPGDPPAARRRLGVAVDRLPTLAAGALQVIVVYDSTIEEEPGVGGRVKTCFASPGRSADEEIVDLARAVTGPVVVVSGDRMVREQAEAAGALTLWSAALVEWATRR